MKRLKRMMSAVVAFGLMTNLVPAQIAFAAPGDGSFSFAPFRLDSGVAAQYDGDQQTGAGSFMNGGNLGSYAEGMCIPLYVDAYNDGATAANLSVDVEFDYARQTGPSAGTVGYAGLETVAIDSLAITTAVDADLSDFTLTGQDLTTATSYDLLSGGSVAVAATGPFAEDGTLSDDDASRFYTITMLDVPAGETVRSVFCARLSNEAGQYSNGANMHLGLANGGAESLPLDPGSLFELPEITVTKVVDNALGGSAVPADFTMQILDVNNANSVVDSFPGTDPGTTVVVQPGVYSVAEVNPFTEYTAALSGDCSNINAALADIAEQYSCTITNTYTPAVPDPAFITIEKLLPNDNGGNEVVSDFTFTVGGTTVIEGVATQFVPGIYDVAEAWAVAHEGETIDDRYTVSFSDDCAGGVIDLSEGENIVCTITNDDRPASLTVVKLVNGGPVTQSSNFTMTVTGTNVSDAEFPGDAVGTTVTLNAGTYSVSEVAVEDYVPMMSPGCSGTLLPGQSATCTVTNTYFPSTGTVNVTKTVIGSPAADSDFQYVVTQAGEPGPAVNFVDGVATALEIGVGVSFSIDEVAPTDYTVSYNGTCSGVMTGTTVDCEVVNTYVPPSTITVNKILVNDNGGEETVEDFVFTVNGTEVEAGVATQFAPGTYTVAEAWAAAHGDDEIVDWYEVAFEGDCDQNGVIELGVSEGATCTITNDDRSATLSVVKLVNGGPETTQSSDFTLTVDGSNVSSEQLSLAAADSHEFPGNASGSTFELDAGTFAVSELAFEDYAASFDGDCSGTLNPGQNATCTVTNSYTVVPIQDSVMPTLRCVDPSTTAGMLTAYFGYDSANDVSVAIPIGSPENYFTGGGDTALDRGQPSLFEPGEHTDVFSVDFAETIPLTWTLESTTTMSVTADENSPRCTTPEPVTLTVRKIVVNNNGGLHAPGAFTMLVEGTNVSDTEFPGSEVGTVVTFDAGEYSVTELDTLGYTQTLSPGCSGTALPGDVITCTITNDDPGLGGGSGGGGFFIPPTVVVPPPIVLGESDEAEEEAEVVDEVVEEPVVEEVIEAVEEVEEVVPPPAPIVAGATDEVLPRTGLPAAGLLLLPSALLFYVRRREE